MLPVLLLFDCKYFAIDKKEMLYIWCHDSDNTELPTNCARQYGTPDNDKIHKTSF